MAVEKKILPSLQELRKQGAKIFVSYRNQPDSEVDWIHKRAIRSMRAEGRLLFKLSRTKQMEGQKPAKVPTTSQTDTEI